MRSGENNSPLSPFSDNLSHSSLQHRTMFNPIRNLSSSSQLEAVKDGNFFREYVVLELLHIFCVCLSVGLNIVMLVVFARKRRKLLESTFYSVVSVLTTFTLLKALVQAVFVMPQYAVQGALFTDNEAQFFFFLDTLADYGILIFSMVMAGNRFCTFNMATRCPIFSRVKMVLLAGIIGALTFPVILTSIGCTMKYSPSANAYADVCPTTSSSERIQTALVGLYYIICAVSLALYLATYWLIRSQRGVLMKNERPRAGPETVILKQAVVIFGLYIIYIVVSSAVPLHSSDGLSFRLTYLLNVVALLIAAVFPGLLLSSSRDMRSEIYSWLLHCGLVGNEWAARAMRTVSLSATPTAHRRTPSISISPAESGV